ncbi:MAG: HAD-IA family hydrolase [Woeseiaceae bacterium]|nr:HAD-IA family hydrolase [Woeseiaceae bacterium]
MASDPAAIGNHHLAVLFDLDGTLVDTAPDMVAVLTHMQTSRGDVAVAYDLARSNVSNGAAGLIRLAFPNVDDDEHQSLYDDYLALYAEAVCEQSCLFPDLALLLDDLDHGNRPWGVVTNKPRRLTEPLLAKLNLLERAACAISGDTLPQRKPDPAPMLLASRMLGVEPQRVIYVGDSARDIEAGRAAGMTTVAVSYGYISADDDPGRWNADAIVGDTVELTRLLRTALKLEA